MREGTLSWEALIAAGLGQLVMRRIAFFPPLKAHDTPEYLVMLDRQISIRGDVDVIRRAIVNPNDDLRPHLVSQLCIQRVHVHGVFVCSLVLHAPSPHHMRLHAVYVTPS